MTQRYDTLVLGEVRTTIPVTPIPGEIGSGFLYFNLTNMPDFVEEGARLIAETILKRKEITGRPSYVIAPETSMNCVIQLLRSLYNIPCLVLMKRRRPGDVELIHEEYFAVTSTNSNTLYIEVDTDLRGYDIFIVDNVCTTGETIRACCSLLGRLRHSVAPSEAIVLFTEGERRKTLTLREGGELPLISFGHIPLYELDQFREATQYQLYSSASFPIEEGKIDFMVFRHHSLNKEAIAVVAEGTFSNEIQHTEDGWRNIPVRVHDACITSEAFHSQKCDCRHQLERALEYITTYGGIVVYLQQEGRGIGLGDKIRAYDLQESRGLDTVEANRALNLPDDAREYIAVRDILRHFRISSVALMTNNHRKTTELGNLGIEVASIIPMQIKATSTHMARYIKAKAELMGHKIPERFFAELA